MSSPPYSFLALGDSYTIGEGVPTEARFPVQAVQLLRAAGISFSDPVIIAKTGWTTDELMEGIAAGLYAPVHRIAAAATPSPDDLHPTHHPHGALRDPQDPRNARPGPHPHYDFVSLLIGVNNEYRGRGTTEYAEQFEQLLRQAIGFAGGQAANTFVLSIPDWSVTPFAAAHLPDQLGRDRAMVAAEIDAFNAIARQIALRRQAAFIDITAHTRASPSSDPFLPTPNAAESTPAYPDLISPAHPNEAGSWLAADGLHPSGREYRWWAGLLAEKIGERITALLNQ